MKAVLARITESTEDLWISARGSSRTMSGPTSWTWTLTSRGAGQGEGAEIVKFRYFLRHSNAKYFYQKIENVLWFGVAI